MSAFGIAITTFVGQNFGAQQYARVKRSIKVCLGMALGTTIALSILLLVFMEPLLRFFTGDETGIAIGQRFFWVMAPSYFTYVFIEILSGAIRGAGESLQPMLITCFGVCGLRILWLTLVVPRFHTHGDGGHELPRHLGDCRRGVHPLLPADELAAQVHPAGRLPHAGNAVRHWKTGGEGPPAPLFCCPAGGAPLFSGRWHEKNYCIFPGFGL